MMALAICLSACNTKTYQVTVINQTGSPITVGVVKDHGPYEEGFAPIEQLAIDSPLESVGPWGFVVPPNKTADTKPVSGKFSGDTHAYLRVYRGTATNAELISVSPSNPHRLDILLFPGAHNEVVVKEGAKKLDFIRTAPTLR